MTVARTLINRFALSLGVTAILTLNAGCEVEQTREAKMPDVDVDVDPGQLPAYDVETADVSVVTNDVKVKVPDVDVSMEEKTVTVPDIDVDMPGSDSR